MAGKVLRRSLIVIGVVIIVLLGVSLTLSITERGRLKNYLLTALNERFHSDVEVGDVTVYVYPRVYLVAHGISLKFHGRTDVPPLITIDTLSVSASLSELLGKTKHVASVHLQGMNITVPPRPLNGSTEPKPPKQKMKLPLLIDEITADDTKLTTLPRDRTKIAARVGHPSCGDEFLFIRSLLRIFTRR